MKVLGVSILVVTSLLAIIVFVRSSKPSKLELGKPEQLVAEAGALQALALERRFQALEQRVEARPQVVQIVASASSELPPAVPAAAVSEASPEEQRLNEQQADEERIKTYEATLNTEPRDPSWSAAQSQSLQAALTHSGVGARVKGITCASTLCRVQLSHESTQDQMQLGTVIGSVEPFSHGTVYHYDRDANPPTTLLYIVREGERFPR